MTATLPDDVREAPSSAGLPARGEFGPRISGGRPRSGGPDWLRILWMVLSGLLSIVLLMGGYYGVLLWNLERDRAQVDITDVTSATGSQFVPIPGASGLALPDEVAVLEDRTTILLVGSDSRDGLTSEQLQSIGTQNVGTDLTDTIILLQIDPATDAAAMLSFPRDLLVTRCDGSTGKINEAFFRGKLQDEENGGPQCLIETITSLTSIHIDHYVRVDFAGFVKAVDALGGVSFYLDEPIRDQNSGLDVPAGCVEFDGIKAIQFVRVRGIDSDFGRIARQQRFAREMVRKASSAGTLLNPATVTSLVNSVAQTLETDSEFGVSEMIGLLTSMQGITSGSVDGRTVPGYVGTYGQASVVRLADDAELLFDAFRNGDLLPEGVGTSGQPIELGPSTIIPVSIAKGRAEPGTEDQAAEVLADLGFTVAAATDEGDFGFNSSVIFYPEGREDHAEVLSEALGGIPTSQGAAEMGQLQLILGASFDASEFAPPSSDSDDAAVDDAAPIPEPTQEEFRGATFSDVTC